MPDRPLYSNDWIEDCIRYHDRVLIGQRAHWCPEWDYLPIDETCNESRCCYCEDILLLEFKPLG